MLKMTVAELRSRASRVLPHAALSDIHVTELTMKGTHPVVDGPYDVATDLAARGNQRGPSIDCFMRYNVRATTEKSDGEAWSVQLMMVGTWALESDEVFEDHDIASFAFAIGTMTIHPYARECVQAAVSRLGYPPFTLDMLPALTGGHDDDVLEFEHDADFEDLKSKP